MTLTQIIHFNGDYFTEITERMDGYIVASPVMSDNWIAFLVDAPTRSIHVWHDDVEETITMLTEVSDSFFHMHASGNDLYWYNHGTLYRWDGASTDIVFNRSDMYNLSGFQDYFVWDDYDTDSVNPHCPGG